MKKIHIQYHKTKIGEFILGEFENKICIIDWKNRKARTTLDKRIQKGLNAEFVEQRTEILTKAQKQIDEFIKGKRTQFDFPILPVGTDFQKKVWENLQKIPYGKTVSYLELATQLKNPKGVRAVASANGANAMSLVIPCHRVIATGGGLGGYAGGLETKQKLLELEKSNV